MTTGANERFQLQQSTSFPTSLQFHFTRMDALGTNAFATESLPIRVHRLMGFPPETVPPPTVDPPRLMKCIEPTFPEMASPVNTVRLATH